MILTIMYAIKHEKKLPMGRTKSVRSYSEIRIEMRNKLYRKYPGMDYFRVVQFDVDPKTGNRTLIRA